MGFDLGSATGWVAGAPSDKRLQAGVIRLSTKDPDALGEFFARFRDTVDQLFDLRPPTTVVFEQPIMPVGLKMNWRTFRKLYGLAAILEEMAQRRGYRVAEISVPKAKKALALNGHASKSEMVAAASAAGFVYPTDAAVSEREHLADAFACWLVATRQVDPVGAQRFDPLFAGRL